MNRPCASLCIVFTLLVGFFTSASSWALPEVDFGKKYEEQVEHFLKAAEASTLMTKDGQRLAYHVFQRGHDRPSIVIIPGYSESWLMYGELAYDLDGMGYDVFIMDHRGMGFSGRLAPDPKVAHVARFSDYVDDAELFVRQVVLPKTRGSRYILAHSMGGLVTAYLVPKLPGAFKAVLLSAPLFELNTGLIPSVVAYWAVSFQARMGYGDRFAPGRGGFDPWTIDSKSCETTHSEVRCSKQINYYKTVSQTFIAGPSSQWVKAVMDATQDPGQLGEKMGSIPTLLLQAEKDFFVRPEAQEKFCTSAGNCQMMPIAGSYHEIFQEKDAARDIALAALKRHFK